jgi:DNA-directed RNA polymerase specialized sigma24 family protein
MARRPPETADPAVPPFHQLGTEVALAERHALLQRVLIYPASVRRKVVKQSLNGVSDAVIAAELRIPLTDVRAIMEAFTGFSEDQAP